MLKLTHVINSKDVRRDFESMGGTVLLVRITVPDQDSAPYHWMLENGRKPPLDVSVKTSDGHFNYLTFFFQNDRINHSKTTPRVKRVVDGLPVFDLSIWGDGFYVFEQGTVEATLTECKLCLIRSESKMEIQTGVRLGEVTFLFDDQETFQGVIFDQLQPDEITALQVAKII